MNPYHKIQTLFRRDPSTDYKTVVVGDFSLPVFEYLAFSNWELTEKVDGTNIRIIFEGANFGSRLSFWGKTDNAQIPSFLREKLKEIFLPRLPLLNDLFPGPSCLYGEGFGAKIQAVGNKYIPDGQDFVLFDVRVGDWWLDRSTVYDIADNLKINAVPVIGYKNLWETTGLVRDGFISAWGDFYAEGVVARPTVPLFNKDGSRVITKLKYKDFAR